uniref:sulfate transport system permease protein n=1 Tax=Prototheca lentecrescens TaxID=2836214 RepID=UPI0030013260
MEKKNIENQNKRELLDTLKNTEALESTEALENIENIKDKAVEEHRKKDSTIVEVEELTQEELLEIYKRLDERAIIWEAQQKQKEKEKIIDLEEIEPLVSVHARYRKRMNEFRRKMAIITAICIWLIFYSCFYIYLPVYVMFKLVFTRSWAEILEVALRPKVIHSFFLTFKLALLAALLNTIMGYILVWILIRYDFEGKDLLDIAIDLPLGIPTTIAGVTLISVFGNKGWLGPILNTFGLKIIYTQYGAFLAMIFASFPFVVRGVEPILEKFPYGLEEAAWSFGADDFQTALRAIFPTLVPAILTGFILNFTRALGEYGSVVMVAGNESFKNLFLSVLTQQYIEQYEYFDAVVIGAVILISALTIIFIINLIRGYFLRHKLR